MDSEEPVQDKPEETPPKPKKGKSTPKPKPKSRANGTRAKAGGRLPLVAEQAVRENRMATFLREYGKTGKMQHSARTAGISCRTIQKWRATYPEFDEQYEDAHQHYIDVLRTAAFQRAVYGVTNPGKHGDITTYSDNLLMFLMKQADPSFRDKQETSVNVATQINNTTHNVHGNITIIEDADWYGNEAHNLAAEAAAAHLTGPSLPSEVQATCVREAVEQDGNGDVGGTEGTRAAQGTV